MTELKITWHGANDYSIPNDRVFIAKKVPPSQVPRFSSVFFGRTYDNIGVAKDNQGKTLGDVIIDTTWGRIAHFKNIRDGRYYKFNILRGI